VYKCLNYAKDKDKHFCYASKCEDHHLLPILHKVQFHARITDVFRCSQWCCGFCRAFSW